MRPVNFKDIPLKDQPLSERYRVTATDWVHLDGAARMLEEAKTAVLSERMKAQGDRPAAHAERDVKASPGWADYIRKMVDARTAANVKKIEMKYIEMLFMEQQSLEATSRHEGRLSR